MEGSLLDRYLQSLFFGQNFLSGTSFAFCTFRNDLSLSLASIASLLNLLIHSRTHLIHLNNATFSLASGTAFHIISSFSFASLAAPCPFVSDLDHSSVVDLLKSDFEGFFSCLDFRSFPPLRSASSSTKEHIHDVCINV